MSSANFNYNSSTVYLDTLEVENINEVYLEVIDGDYISYFIGITTKDGESKIVTVQPVDTGNDMLLEKFSIEYSKVPSKDKDLRRAIAKQLGGKKRLKSVKDKSPNKDNDYTGIKIVNVLDKESFANIIKEYSNQIVKEIS